MWRVTRGAAVKNRPNAHKILEAKKSKSKRENSPPLGSTPSKNPKGLCQALHMQTTTAVPVPRGPARIALCDRVVTSLDTLRRVYRGYGSANMRERVRRAAADLGLPLPPSAVVVSKHP